MNRKIPRPSRKRFTIAVTHSVLKKDMLRHIRFTLGSDPYKPDKFAAFMGLAYSVRDRLIDRWIETQRSLYDTMAKRVYFLSMEFLPGRFLKNYLISLGMETVARETLDQMGFDLDELEEEEWDAGLGNGGLGRLASCYMDSMACRRLPGYGYGIRYDYGIFHQVLEDGWQREHSDNWMRRGNPWEIQRSNHPVPIRFFGRSEGYVDALGRQRFRWVEGEVIMAMACDLLVPGLADHYVTNMRLWTAQSSREFNLEYFNQGDYIRAMEAKVLSENISRVLYPSDEQAAGRELRLKQQYFFVAATLDDILRRFRKQGQAFTALPDWVAIQLNDTHPSIAVAELMRILVDIEGLEWEAAWTICESTFGYTNHTLLPEALETWPVDLFGRILPRHLEIIYEINYRFLEHVRRSRPDDPHLPARLSLIQEGEVKRIRMAHLAIVGSHHVNGVAVLHSRILRESLFKEFEALYPGRFGNVTNGITPRRWLLQANPSLSRLITSAIGPEWLEDLGHLIALAPLAADADFRTAWMRIKLNNKMRLARYALRKVGLGIDPETLFDVQVKRIHEYKRQLMNVLHVIALYRRIKIDPDAASVPRTVIFAGKAAPAYHRAKLIIKLITCVADSINKDPDMGGRLRVIFLPNYCVSQAEKIIPAADLSEQISTAGMEASGTGNMKLSLNGALTIGTLDGANIEIMEEVGRDKIFIFGLSAEQVAACRAGGYNPRACYEAGGELKAVLDMIGAGHFSPGNPSLFSPLIDALLHQGDFYMVLADYNAYAETQLAVERLYNDRDAWARCSILNTAHMGKFSSDRAIMEYAQNIWKVQPVQ
jgi:glycogen phosphorylase